MPVETPRVEFIVGLFQNELRDRPLSDDEFMDTLTQSCSNQGVEPPALTLAQIAAIRAAIADLLHRWETLGTDATMELPFASSAPTPR